MHNLFLILVVSVFLTLGSCSSNNSSGSTGIPNANLSMRVDGRLFTSNKGFGIYNENTITGTIIKSVGFGHNAEVNEESIELQSGSEVTPGVVFTFNSATPLTGALNSAIYKKANTTSTSNAYTVAALTGNAKSRFTYKIIRIFDNPAGVTGKSVEFDFSGVIYKNNNANDSVVITEGTVRY